MIPANSRFSKCSTCCSIKDQLADLTLTEQMRECLDLIRLAHNKEQSREREHRNHHKLKAKTNPTKFLYISVDGMDSHKTCLPQLVPYRKDASESDVFCEPHVVGTISTTAGYVTMLVPELFKQDPNLTVTCLAQVLFLCDIPLPPILYIHVRELLFTCWSHLFSDLRFSQTIAGGKTRTMSCGVFAPGLFLRASFSRLNSASTWWATPTTTTISISLE